MKLLNLRRTVFSLALISFTLMIGQNGWNTAHAAKLEKDVVKVGFAGGLNFIFGKQMLQGAQMAADEINNAGGVLGSKIEIISADSGATAAGAASAIAKLVTSDKVDYLIGAYPSEEATVFVRESYNRKIISIFNMASSMYDEVYQTKPAEAKYGFVISAAEPTVVKTFTDALPAIAKTLEKELNLKKINVALITDNALWTANIDNLMKDFFAKSKDVNFVYHAKPARNATDFTTELTEIMKKDVHLVLVFSGFGSAFPLIKQFNQMKVPALLGGYIIAAMGPDDFIRAVGPENTAYVFNQSFGTEVASPRDAQLVNAFKAKHGAYPSPAAVEGYGMIKVFAKALEKAGTMKNDVLIPAIEKVVVPPNQAWGGAIRFENHRAVSDYDLNKGTRLYLVQYTPQGDKAPIIFPEKYATTKLQIPPHMIKKWKK